MVHCAVDVQQMTDSIVTSPVAGIMGLAFQPLASSKAAPWWEVLSNDNQWSSPEMSVWLTRFINDNNAQDEEPGGLLTLGGTNNSLYTGNIQFVDMPSGVTPSFWFLELTGVTVQGNSVKITSGNSAISAIDTGTTLIGGPTADVQNIWAQVPGSTAMAGNMAGFYEFPCDTNVQISLSFGGGSSWPISTSDMNVGTSGTDGQCVGGIFDLSAGSNAGGDAGNPSWVVGDTFLKNVYSVFRSNPPSVGFAELSDAAGGSSGTPGSAPAHVSGVDPLPTGSSNSGMTRFRTNSIGALSTSLLITLVTSALMLC